MAGGDAGVDGRIGAWSGGAMRVLNETDDNRRETGVIRRQGIFTTVRRERGEVLSADERRLTQIISKEKGR